MDISYFVPLKNRSIIELSGENIADFLQGIIAKNINALSKDISIYSCMLTPQGKFLFDFFITIDESKYLIDIHEEYKEDFIKKLKIYRLRSKIDIKDLSDEFEVAALIGDEVYNNVKNIAGYTYKFCNGIAYIDPRSEILFARSIIKKENDYQSFKAKNFIKGDYELYEDLRIRNTIPEGLSDLRNNESFPLHFGLDKLDAIDFDKGCYVGQEVTTRSKHRGKSKKNICTLISEDVIELEENEILVDGKKVGNLLSSQDKICLALLDNKYIDDNITYKIGSLSFKLLNN